MGKWTNAVLLLLQKARKAYWAQIAIWLFHDLDCHLRVSRWSIIHLCICTLSEGGMVQNYAWYTVYQHLVTTKVLVTVTPEHKSNKQLWMNNPVEFLTVPILYPYVIYPDFWGQTLSKNSKTLCISYMLHLLMQGLKSRFCLNYI